MKKVLILAPQFPPCNLTAGHRTRLLARHLPEFGYHPIVMTSRQDLYEECFDMELMEMVVPHLELIQVGGIPVRPFRIIGDIGARTFFPMLLAAGKLIKAGNVDLVCIPIPPNYTALLGPLLKAFYGTPFIVDYIDPWVYPISDQDRQSTKAMVSHGINRILEPIVAYTMDGVTGVAESYMEGIFQRHPQTRDLPRAGVPYGSESLDHLIALEGYSNSEILHDYQLTDCVTLVYAGAFLPRSVVVAKCLFEAVKACRSILPLNFKIIFVGTGLNQNHATGPLTPLALECGVADLVVEIPKRQPFGAILRLLYYASGVLVLGSTEKHYTASKTFQALQSESSILALLHEESHAAQLLQSMQGVSLVTFGDEFHQGISKPNFETGFLNWVAKIGQKYKRTFESLPEFTARSIAKKMAGLYDKVLGITN